MALIYVAGLSGSGKSTIVEMLRQKGYEAHDADVALCKWYDNESGEEVAYPRDKTSRPPDWQEHHTFRMSEDLVASIAAHSQDKTVFILGIAPNDLDLAPAYFDNVLFLHISKEEMMRRVTSRTNNKYGHDADQLAVIKKWYQPTIDKYKNHGAHFIDAEQPIEKVVDNMLRAASS